MTDFPRLVDFDFLVNALDRLQCRSEELEGWTTQQDYDDKVAAVEAVKAEILSSHAALAARVVELEGALREIARYEEGPVVTGSFDEPGSAEIARAALSRAGVGSE